MRVPHSAGAPASRLTWALAAASAFAPVSRATAQPGTLGIAVAAEGETGVVTNPRFQSAADSTDVLSRARVGASLTRRSARGAFTATTDGELQRFAAAPDLSRSTYGASASATERVTPRLDVGASAGVRTSLSRDVTVGATPAIGNTGTDDATAGPLRDPSAAGAIALPLLPLTRSHTYAADAAASYRTSPLTTVTANAGFDRIRYDASALASGSSMRARLEVARQVGTAAGVSATLDATRTETDGRTLIARTAMLGWDTRLRDALQLRLRAGAGAFTTPQTSTFVRPVGSAELGAPLWGGAWSVHYLRDVTPVLGIGQMLTSDQGGASYTRVAPGGIVVHVGVEQAWTRVPTTPGSQTITNASFADVRRPLGGGFWAGAGAARRSRTQDPTVRSQNLSLTAGYAGSW